MKRAGIVVLMLVGFQAAVASAAGTFIPAANRVDMVHDAKRGVIYISSSDGQVLRYHVASAAFLAPIATGGQPGGIDLSPDGNILAIADRTRGEDDVWVHRVDLSAADPEPSKLLASRDFGEGGTWTVAFDAAGKLLVTSMYEGSGWAPMRRFDVSTGGSSKLADVRQNTMIAASGDGQTIAFAESNSSDGPWGLYDIPTGQLVRRQWYENGTSWFNYEIATDQLGSQFAIPTYGGTFIYNDVYAKIATIGTYAGAQPIGVAYHPVQNRIYFPWASTSEVRVYDSTTLTQVGSIDFEDTFQHNGNHAFQQGRTRLSRDGSMLMVTVSGGVRFVQLYAPLAAPPVSARTYAGTQRAIQLKGSIGNGGKLSYSIATQPAHGIAKGSSSIISYIPAPGFVGTDTFKYRVRYGRATVDATVSVVVAPVPAY